MIYSHFRSEYRRRILYNYDNWWLGINAHRFALYDSGFVSGKKIVKNQFVIHNAFSNGDSIYNYVNGVEFDKKKAIKVPGGNLRLGLDEPYCNFLEIIMINDSITPQQRQSIDHYLMDKYAPPVNLGPDKKVCSFPDSIALGIDYALNYQWSTGDTTDAIQLDSAGKYYVTITDMFERTSIDSIYISKDTNDFKIKFPFSDTTICKGDTVQLEAQNFERFSYQWNTADTTTAIKVVDAGEYILSVQNCLNNSYSDTIDVLVNQPKFSLGADTTLCFNSNYQLKTDSIFSNVDYLWSTNDSSAAITVDSAKIYWLKVSDQFGCSYTDSITVQVDSTLFGLSLGPDTTRCAGNKIGLSLQDSTINYLWNTGDTTAVISVDSSGTYILNVSDKRCTITDSIHVNIKGKAPSAAFSASNFCYLDSVRFNDFSRVPIGDSIVSWQWDFRDGDTAAVRNPIHQFNAVQSYPVILQVKTDKGCIDTAQQAIHIRPKPQSDFRSTVSCAKKNVYFYDQSSLASGRIIGYLWNFGDSTASINSSNRQNPVHQYDTLGNYPVRLITTSNFGCKDTLVRHKRINPTPIVDFSYQGSCFGDSTQFINESSLASGEIKSVNWYANNQSLMEENPKVLFNAAGNQVVSLSLTSDSSCAAGISKNIKIHQRPTADFISELFCEKEQIRLFDKSSGDHKIQKWEYVMTGDTIRQQNPAFSPKTAGVYPVSLLVEDQYACRDSIRKNIIVNPKPQAEFQIINNGSGAPYRLRVENQSVGAEQYIWDFGNNGDSLHGEIPDYWYEEQGNYLLSLIAVSDKACSDTASETLRILPYYLDAMIHQMALKQDGELLKIQLQIANTGNNVIENMQLATTVNNGATFVEKLEGPIFKSRRKGYQLQSGILLKEQIDFVCSRIISVNDTIDAVEKNNLKCEAPAFTNELFVRLYPNPSAGNLKMEYVLPQQGTLNIRLYDQLGKEVFRQSMNLQEKGYYFSLLRTNQLNSGIYHYVVQFNDQKQNGTFIKQ